MKKLSLFLSALMAGVLLSEKALSFDPFLREGVRGGISIANHPLLRTQTQHLKLHHVGLRDGLQIILTSNRKPLIIDPKTRFNLMKNLYGTGCFKTVEGISVTKLPQMQGWEEMLQNFCQYPSLPLDAFPILTPNYKGLEKLQEVGNKLGVFNRGIFSNEKFSVRFVIGTSDDFNRKNLGKNTNDIENEITACLTKNHGSIEPAIYLSTFFGSPFNDVSFDGNLAILKRLYRYGCEIIVSDTTGIATSSQILELAQFAEENQLDKNKITFHLHQQEGHEMDLTLLALQYGFTNHHVGLDIENQGGCPSVSQFKPKGNANMSDLKFLQKIGISGESDSMSDIGIVNNYIKKLLKEE